MIELTIPVPTPSLNRTHGSHWSHYTKVRKAWREEVWAASVNAKCGRPQYPRSSLTIERYGKRMLDPDNFSGGLKAVIDALKLAGLILDDSTQHITLTATQHVGPPPYRTVIRIEPHEDLT